MNAALVLMTAAWMAGDHNGHAPAPAAPVQPHYAHGCTTGGYHHGCYTTCCDPCSQEGFFDRLRNRMGGLFGGRRNDCCDPCGGFATTGGHHGRGGCCTTTVDCCQTWSCSCQTTTGHGLFGGGGGFGQRMRGLFSRGNGGSDCCPCYSHCGTNGCYGAGVPGGPGIGAEKVDIPGPKKMPPAPDGAPDDLPPGNPPAGTGHNEPPIGDLQINDRAVPPVHQGFDSVPPIPPLPGTRPSPF